MGIHHLADIRSNNTNKFSPQEPKVFYKPNLLRSNNTNKFSPQEQWVFIILLIFVQIIQINLVLKNRRIYFDS